MTDEEARQVMEQIMDLVWERNRKPMPWSQESTLWEFLNHND